MYRTPRRSRRSTDTSAGLQLRRTSQQSGSDAPGMDQRSTASQIVQSMQSMPAPHARQAALAVRRTLVNKLALAAKASAIKQQQEQQQADEAVSRSAASAWPQQAGSPGYSTTQASRPQQAAVSSSHAQLSQGGSASAGHSSAQQPAAERAVTGSQLDLQAASGQGRQNLSASGQPLSQAAPSAPAQQLGLAQQTQQAQSAQQAQQAQQAGPSSNHAADIRSTSSPHAAQTPQHFELLSTAASQLSPDSQPRTSSATDASAPDPVHGPQATQAPPPTIPSQAQPSTDEEDWWEKEQEEQQEEEDLLNRQHHSGKARQSWSSKHQLQFRYCLEGSEGCGSTEQQCDGDAS